MNCDCETISIKAVNECSVTSEVRLQMLKLSMRIVNKCAFG
jgi:hypothetical protein